ncbi:unnamed protein product [Rotaria sp. Silwood1]|nr:unnamed protein product [Rotaria sp. Silwood1]CAF1583518.1 unnamed protein product [Rotaria sp. Silwood1]CAF1583640.1 unnamed protein product [Rotaria sp. Silwood1]CAF3671850.1 unnamed protein product [Rotaria sp. Silwood1]CAF3754767.1 unnamed protein product [Rotaria sp. Silwood1]
MTTKKMLLILCILLGYALCSQTAILQCDFDVDTNWGLTDGFHPQSINHDHTLNNSSGHYLFYNPKS